MSRPATDRLVLLAGQAFSLGMLSALVVIAANALFLTEYGSQGLPYTYIGIAAVGVPASMMLARALRRWRLPLVASVSMASVTVLYVMAWAAVKAGAVWVSAALLVLFVVVLQVGFVFIGGQAGRLLDVRQIKAYFPRIVAGLPFGFLAGGLVGPLIIRVTGHTEDLLLGAAIAACAFLGLVVLAGRRHPVELALLEPTVEVPRPPLRRLLAERFVVLIMAYQVLSAMGSQFLDFLVFDRAAARYASAEDLAQAVSAYTVAMNAFNIAVLALVAGYLMRRFGLRFGFTANPVAAAGLVALAVVVALVGGGEASLGLLLVVAAARIVDITATDGMTRTSTNAAYQALPPMNRLPVQATVEGVGVPAAIGLSGALLIAADLTGLGFTAIAVATLVLCVSWSVAGFVVYRGYAARLVTTLRQRMFDPEALVVDEPTLEVVDGLLAAADPADVRLGLDVLDGVEHPALVPRLLGLAIDGRPEVRAEALRRLGPAGADDAREPARRALTDDDGAVRREAVCLLGRLGSPGDIADATTLLDDADPGVAVAATALAAGDGTPLVAEAAVARLRVLAGSSDPTVRRLVAESLLDDRIDSAVRSALVVDLAGDDHADVRAAALAAAAVSGEPPLVALVLRGLDDARTASAAAAALPLLGRSVVEPLDATLSAHTGSVAPTPGLLRLVRACAGCPEAGPVLARHVLHPDREVQRSVLVSLGHLCEAGPAGPADRDLADAAGLALQAATAHAARCLSAAATLEAEGTEPLVRALADEADAARELTLAALALRHDRSAVNRASRLLADGDDSRAALALEMLEVNLSPDDRRVVLPLLQPGMSRAERSEALARRFPVSVASDAGALLADLALDRSDAWRQPWLRICAVHAIGAGARRELSAVVEAAAGDRDPDVAVTARWAVERLSVGPVVEA